MSEELPNDGEIATNEEWRGVMKRARKDHGLTQEQLGKLVGVSQVMITKIESGAAASSSAVLAICRALSIPEPMTFATEDAKHWHELGHAARRVMSAEQYEAHLKMIEMTVRQLEVASKPAPGDSDGDRRK